MGIFGSGNIKKGLDLADKYILDKDKKEELVAGVVNKMIDSEMQKTNPLLDGIHKLGRQFISVGILLIYWDSKVNGYEIDLFELLAVAAPGSAYIIAKTTEKNKKK